MEFTVFKNGKERIVKLDRKDCTTELAGQIIPSWRADTLYKLQETYLYNKQLQRQENTKEAVWFYLIARDLPLTRDVIRFICKCIRERPYDPKNIKKPEKKVEIPYHQVISWILKNFI